MKRLLDIEFFKFKNSRSSKVVTIVYLVIVMLLLLVGLYRIDVNGQVISFAEMGIFDFPFVWHLNTYIASFLKFLIAIVIVSLTASEYSNRTLKQNLIDGLSKKEIILSKFYFVITLAFLVTVLVTLISFILGLIYSNYTEVGIITRDFQYIGAFFISHLTFFSLCLFAGILVKRSAFALGLIGIWGIFEFFLFGMSKLIKAYYQIDIWTYLGEILPFSAIWSLIVEPFSKISLVKSGIEMLPLEIDEMKYDVPLISVVICLIWTGIFIYSSYLLLKRRDL